MLIKDELEYIEIENSVASAKIALQGAHIFEYALKGKENVLFLSETALFKKGNAIRGGIPVCWPWFGTNAQESSLPRHGFARTSLWKHISTKNLSDSLTKVTLKLQSSPQTLVLWPYIFRLTLDIYIGESLRLELTSENIDTKPFDISSALHTYLKVEDVENIELYGLEKKPYFDQTTKRWEHQEGVIDFRKEVDRIYQNVENDVVVKDKNHQYTVYTEGTQSIVIWNPGEKLAYKMQDLSQHTKMLCVESSNVLDYSVTLNPGDRHTLTQVITTDFLTFL